MPSTGTYSCGFEDPAAGFHSLFTEFDGIPHTTITAEEYLQSSDYGNDDIGLDINIPQDDDDINIPQDDDDVR